VDEETPAPDAAQPADAPTEVADFQETLGNRIDLPSGAWALIRDIDANPIRVKERKAIVGAINSLANADDFSRGSGTMEVVLALVVRQWSHSLALGRIRAALLMPSARPDFLQAALRDLTALVGDLPVADYDALMPYVEPAMKAAFPTFGATEQTITDPKVPTEPSAASNGLSLVGAPTAATLSPTSTAT
jgi:hypothetical protein